MHITALNRFIHRWRRYFQYMPINLHITSCSLNSPIDGALAYKSKIMLVCGLNENIW